MRIILSIAGITVLLIGLGCATTSHETALVEESAPSAEKSDFSLTELYRPETATGNVKYRLRYIGVNPYPSASGPIQVFEILESHPNRGAKEMTFDGDLPMVVGAIVECSLPARDLGRCIDAPIDSYWKRPAREVFADYLTNGE